MLLVLDKAIDTNKYFIICANVIGGCLGSFGPSELTLKQIKFMELPSLLLQ